ncbi:uncharacterized protein AKAW2_30020A [Aspergillus luchuensis]|uniref:Uncharacterized protein n=1 Tax=Aspergillus kawachii TaxID=1069201 RepID=A0A7R7W5E1_ASPKA|nr:uncharacterized protein AKAW2_30020A [Aspergillus luchuensis]BCR96701.1 hypothetical protein AKAW2_30020A [Aspergillus luchuensis]
MPSYPETELYVKFVDAGDFPHIGSGQKEAPLPSDLKNHVRDISKVQKEKLIAAVTQKITTLQEAQTQVPPLFGKEGSSAKEEWEKLLRMAVEKKIPGAGEALEKLGSLQVSEEGRQEDQLNPSMASPSLDSDSRGAPNHSGADGMDLDNQQETENNDQQENPQEKEPSGSDTQSPARGENNGQPENPQEEEPSGSDTQPSVAVKREESPSRITASIPSVSPEPNRPRPGHRLELEDELDEVPCENVGWTQVGEDKCHDWPWVTMPLPNGGAIMAEKQTNRQSLGSMRAGKKDTISLFVVEIPVLEEVEGTDEWRTVWQRRLVRYQDYRRHIDAWRKKTEEHERCIFSASDKYHQWDILKNCTLRRLEFTASLTARSRKSEKTNRGAPETECLVWLKEELLPKFVPMYLFKRWQTETSAMELIHQCCVNDGLILPSMLPALRDSTLNADCPENRLALHIMDTAGRQASASPPPAAMRASPLPPPAATRASTLPPPAATRASTLPPRAAMRASPLPPRATTRASPLPSQATTRVSPLPPRATTQASPLPSQATTRVSPLPPRATTQASSQPVSTVLSPDDINSVINSCLQEYMPSFTEMLEVALRTRFENLNIY